MQLRSSSLSSSTARNAAQHAVARAMTGARSSLKQTKKTFTAKESPYFMQSTPTLTKPTNKKKKPAQTSKASAMAVTDIEALVPHVSVMPKNWSTVYEAIRTYRAQLTAPVDVVGCHILGDRCHGPKTYRFQTLVALMLSAQTKDQTTGQAMHGLRVRFGRPGDAEAYKKQDISEAGELGDAIVSGTDQKEGFTAWTLSTASHFDIDMCINKVGFHTRKAKFIQETAQLCVESYHGDIPDTLPGLLALPGVGPKMAFLALQAAWGKSIGIGVDTHVHRISNRLGWVHTKQPEETRQILETFVPQQYWAPINPLLVGFGQTTCLPVSPLCQQCPVRDQCPSSHLSRKTKTLK
ncbi:DNA glycosylase [Syncephalis fuscata]|nr:DNA glycosylase [Syncephalis fuscata]